VRALAWACSVSLAVPLALASMAGSLHAQTPPVDAEALLRQGVELRRAGEEAQALDVFRRAYELTPSPLAAAQMGLAEQALGRWLDAEQHVVAALAARDDAWIVRNRESLERALTVIRSHVARLEVLGGVPGAAVIVDGERRGVLPLGEPIRMVAGRATLEVRLSGYYEVRRAVDVRAGSVTRESIVMRALPAGVAAGTVDPSRPGADPRVVRPLAVVLWGAGVGMLTMGIASHAVRENVIVSYNQSPACPGTDAAMQPADCRARMDTASVGLGLAVTGYVGAVALVTVGTVVQLATGSSAGVARVTVNAGAGWAHVAFGARF